MSRGAKKPSHRYVERVRRTDKCLTVKIDDQGRTLVCWRSPEHNGSAIPERRQHYDPSAEEFWDD